jgi:hypothetical protein
MGLTFSLDDYPLTESLNDDTTMGQNETGVDTYEHSQLLGHARVVFRLSRHAERNTRRSRSLGYWPPAPQVVVGAARGGLDWPAKWTEHRVVVRLADLIRASSRQGGLL